MREIRMSGSMRGRGHSPLPTLPMQVLVTAIALEGRHVLHPEMMEKGTEHMHGLFEGHLYLEAVAVEANDLNGIECQVGAHEDALAPGGMGHGHESHDDAHGPPKQVGRADAQLDAALAIDGTVDGVHGVGLVE